MAFLKFLLALVVVLSLAACSVEESAGDAQALSWTAPSEREDNSALSLSEIASFRIYYGTKAGDYQNQIEINDSSATQGQLAGLASGTYYVVVTAVDTDGRESLYSSEVVITI